MLARTTPESAAAAFFRLEGAVAAVHALSAAAHIAASAPSVRQRLVGRAMASLGAGLSLRTPIADPRAGARLAWSSLRGLSRDRIEVLAEDFARDHALPAIRHEAKRLVDHARRDGAILVLVSDGLDVVARAVASELGFSHVVANALVYVDDEATGELASPIIGPEIDAPLALERVRIERSGRVAALARRPSVRARAGPGARAHRAGSRLADRGLGSRDERRRAQRDREGRTVTNLEVRKALAGKRLLVTGVTGFVAKVFVAFLLENVPSIGRITLLARGRRGQTPAQRAQRIVERSPVFRPLRARHGAALGELVRTRLEVVDGDARKPLLGIDEAHLAELAARIDCVVHVAGLTDFVPDPKDGIAVNVRGAMVAADVAARTRGGLLLHVSTGFVAGKVDGRVEETLEIGLSPNGTRFDPASELRSIESQIDASVLRHPDAAEARRARIDAGQQRANALGWPNLYTYGKALAEQMIASRTDVRVVIVRPSIVECARRFPFTGWNEGLNTSGPLVWLTGTLHRRMPFAKDHCFDVIPVDTVARGMTLVLAESLVGDPALVYQLASGDTNPFTFGRALDLTSLARRRQYQRSEDLFERLVLGHMDSVIAGKPASSDAMLPTARAVTRAARDALVAFNPDTHLPAAIRERFGAQLGKLAQRAGKELGTASRTIGQVEEMLRLYQPFVWDHDAELVTARVRALSARLSAEERAIFGWDVETIDWRSYWLDVQIPGLDQWSLPVLRGERVPEDPPFELGEAVREVGARHPMPEERAAHERALAALEEGAE